MAYNFIAASNGDIPPGAVVAGKDVDGSTLYAGRAFHDGETVPAKIAPKQGGAFVPHGCKENSKFTYEVLCSNNVAWKYSRDGQVPHNAVVMGNTKDGEPLYMGRVWHKGSLTPGKVHPSHGVLYIPFGGEEINHKEYEVLIVA